MIKNKELPGIFFLALLWAPSFLFIRIGVETLHPLTFTMVRCLFAALTLIAFSFIKRIKVIPYFAYTKQLLPTALYLNAIPFALCATGEQFVDSSTAAIIEGAVPIFTILIAYSLFQQRDISRRHVLCIFIGFLGLVITFLPMLSSMEIKNVFGFFAVVLMAFFFAFGFLYSEKHIRDIPPIESTTIQMLFTSLT
ncbi:MAG: DMT family transporter, partial [Chlamydiales bacterium]|nr:DMT family transporter [Chlamydiales bacterium]